MKERSKTMATTKTYSQKSISFFQIIKTNDYVKLGEQYARITKQKNTIKVSALRVDTIPENAGIVWERDELLR